MTPRDAFTAAILAQRDEPAHQLVYADWLDEHGAGEANYRLAYAYRWMARRGKFPAERLRYAPTPQRPSGAGVPADYRWAWLGYAGYNFEHADANWRERHYGIVRGGDSALHRAALPRVPFLAMCTVGNDHRYYPSFDAAVTALADALHTLRAAASCDPVEE